MSDGRATSNRVTKTGGLLALRFHGLCAWTETTGNGVSTGGRR